MPFALSVNLNKIALLRNSRTGNYPNVTDHAKSCLTFGANGITVHPRPDQRHIRPNDCYELASLLKPLKDTEFNIEGNPFEQSTGSYPGLLSIIETCLPDQATLVPDQSDQLTSDHGFDLNKTGESLKPIIAQLKTLGVRVSLFMDPDLKQIELAKSVGADRIELYTGPFADAFSNGDWQTIYEQHKVASEYATSIGLGVNAGHDLNLGNMEEYRKLPGLLEVSIGHALTVESMHLGLEETVQRYLSLCR
jgi:pyridoxine 5-phosphate synthase